LAVQPGQTSLERTGKAGRPEHGNKDVKAGTGQPGWDTLDNGRTP
jgi:hypothetical protein